MAKRPDNLGISGGGFAPCPDSPNCVSTRTDASDPHFIEPMDFLSGGGDSTRAAVLAAIEALPRTRIIEQADDYLYAECTSLIFRFVDDLEVHFDDARQQVHFRSASRVGHSDMGANRKRVEQIKSKASGE